MSRAFVKEQDADPLEVLPDRPISQHPNDVTQDGMTQLERCWMLRAKPMLPHTLPMIAPPRAASARKLDVADQNPWSYPFSTSNRRRDP